MVDPNSQNRAQSTLSAVINHPAFLRVASVIAVALFAASFFPAALVPVVVRELLLVGGLAMAAAAMLRGETFAKRRFNRWDEAMILFAVAFLSGALVDPEAASQTLQAMAGNAPYEAATATPPTADS